MSHILSPTALAASQQAAIGSSQALFELTLHGLEKWSSLHFDTARRAAGSWYEHASQPSANDAGEFAARHAEFVRPQLENLSAYLHQLLTLALDAQAGLLRQAEQGRADWNRALNSSLDWYAGPGQGPTFTVDAIKSAISAANSAFDQANRTVRQVADIAGASVSAASSATLRATGPAGRKKAA